MKLVSAVVASQACLLLLSACSSSGSSDALPLRSGRVNFEWAHTKQAEATEHDVPDAAVRSSINSSGLPWLVEDKATGIEMVLVPASSRVIAMGLRYGQPPAHARLESPSGVDYDYYIARYETWAWQWILMRDKVLLPENAQLRTPANNTDLWQILTALEPQLGVRLPSVTEWKYAMGFTRPNSPPGPSPENAWYASNSGNQYHASGLLEPNGLGVHDLWGNVSEWCMPQILSVNDQPRSCSDATNVLRASRGEEGYSMGGDIDSTLEECRSDDAQMYFIGQGFRVVRCP